MNRVFTHYKILGEPGCVVVHINSCVKKYRDIGLDHETSKQFKKYQGMAGDRVPVFPNVL